MFELEEQVCACVEDKHG